MKSVQGWTLMELLVVLALFAITASLALPNLADWNGKNHARTQAERLGILFTKAKAEALRTGVPVYVCPANVKSNGETDGHCMSRYFGLAFTAWADINGGQSYGGKDKIGSTGEASTDLIIRDLVLNETKGNAIWLGVEHLNGNLSANSQGERADMFAFMPNGSFLRFQSNNKRGAKPLAQFYGTDFVKFTFSVAHQDAQTRQNRFAVLFLDRSGQAHLCERFDQRPICQFSDPIHAKVGYHE